MARPLISPTRPGIDSLPGTGQQMARAELRGRRLSAGLRHRRAPGPVERDAPAGDEPDPAEASANRVATEVQPEDPQLDIRGPE